MNNLNLNKKIDGMTLEDLESVMVRVVKETLKKDFENIDKKFDEMNEKFENIDKKFDEMNEKFENIDKKFDEMNEKFEKLETGIKIIKLTQDYIKETANFSLEKPLDSVSLASFLADEKEENSYFKLFR